MMVVHKYLHFSSSQIPMIFHCYFPCSEWDSPSRCNQHTKLKGQDSPIRHLLVGKDFATRTFQDSVFLIWSACFSIVHKNKAEHASIHIRSAYREWGIRWRLCPSIDYHVAKVGSNCLAYLLLKNGAFGEKMMCLSTMRMSIQDS